MRTAVGIDISKGKSSVAVIREDDRLIASFILKHTNKELAEFAERLFAVEDEIRVVCEETGNYAAPVVRMLKKYGVFVSCINPVLIKNFGEGTLHSVKTDKADAEKIARYGLLRWFSLEEAETMEKLREQLKIINHQRMLSVTQKTAANNSLISLTDKVYPGINQLFSRTSKPGHEKWVDFLKNYWHPEVVLRLSSEEFKEDYKDWCRREGYQYSESKALRIYAHTLDAVYILEEDEVTGSIVLEAVNRLNMTLEQLQRYDELLIETARKLPEFGKVREFPGVGELSAAELIAEIGDLRRFKSKKALIAYAGIDPGANQSGSYDRKSNRTTKREDSFLRAALFNIMQTLLMRPPEENTDVYDFSVKKKNENKPYRVYMTAGSARFLRVYYGTISEFLNSLN